MLIETETTPNPSTLKFLPGRAVMDMGTRDFATPEEADASPLAEALFTLGDVEGVFFGRDFVSVTAGPGSNWSDLKPDVLSILLDHFAGGIPLFKPATAGGISVAAEVSADDPEDADIIDQIKDLIETRVRPAVAGDGGKTGCGDHPAVESEPAPDVDGNHALDEIKDEHGDRVFDAEHAIGVGSAGRSAALAADVGRREDTPEDDAPRCSAK